MPLQLNTQASVYLSEVIKKNNGQLPPVVEQQLQALEQQQATQQAGQAAPLTLEQVEKVLQQAMPSVADKKLLKDACDVASGYHADGKNAKFLTQILSTKVLKVNEVQVHNPSVPVRRYDPYIAEFTLDPKAQTMLLFNAQNVDRNGNALLMKLVMRMDPKTEKIVGAGEEEINALVKKTFDKMRPHNAALMEADVRAFFGVPQVGADRADVQVTNWLTQISANANWMTQNAPDVAKDKVRAGEVLVQVNEAKDRFIGQELPKIDLTRYRREPADAKPDVHLVGAKATYVQTHDTHEHEFAFGAPLKQVSLGANNKELSSSVFVRPENEQHQRAWNDPQNASGRQVNRDTHTVNDTLDNAQNGGAVRTFDDRVRVSVKAKEGAVVTPGQWLDEKNALPNVEVALHIDRGVIFEPGAQASVTILGGTVSTAIPVDDAQLLGNPASTTKVDTSAKAAFSMRDFLTSQVQRNAWAQKDKADNTRANFTVASLVYANATSIEVGSRKLTPLGDTMLKQSELAANKIKLDAVPKQDPENDGVTMKLTLAAGFLGSTDKSLASVEGYTVQVGYFDENNKWIEEKSMRVRGTTKSEEATFKFDIPDFDALQKPKDGAGNPTKHLEIRLYNADGIPAERIKIPFREVIWGD